MFPNGPFHETTSGGESLPNPTSLPALEEYSFSPRTMLALQLFPDTPGFALNITTTDQAQFPEDRESLPDVGNQLVTIPRSPTPAFPPLTNPHISMKSDDLRALLFRNTRSDMVQTLLNYLDDHTFSGNVTDIRATMITPFATILYEHSIWPLMTWKESCNVDVMAIFKVPVHGPCSVLLHYGSERAWDGWKDELVGWYVREMREIEELLIASWQIGAYIKEGKFDDGTRETSRRSNQRVAYCP